jgi:hypothetical protein
MLTMTAEEMALMQQLAKGEITTTGNVSDAKWQRLIDVGYISYQIPNLSSVIYTITEEGREALEAAEADTASGE